VRQERRFIVFVCFNECEESVGGYAVDDLAEMLIFSSDAE